MKPKISFPLTLTILLLWLLPIATVLADGGHGDDTAASNGGSPILITAVVSVVFIVGGIFLANEGTLGRYGLFSIILGTITGAIHLNIGLNGNTLLLLNGLGYFGLIAALYLPIAALTPFRKWIRLLLIVYTLITIVAYIATHPPAYMSTTGILDKIVEVLLIVSLVIDHRKN